MMDSSGSTRQNKNLTNLKSEPSIAMVTSL